MSESSNEFPLVTIKLEPKSKSDQDLLALALASVVRSDPNAYLTVDAQIGEITIGGMSELHLEGVIGTLLSQGVAVNIGAPQVAYRETITRKAKVDYIHRRLTGVTREFARVILEIEPNENGAGFVFENKIVGGTVPTEFTPSVAKGLNSVMSAGVLAGFPMVDIKIALTDGAYHDVDSSDKAFEIAASMGLREGLRKADAVLLEPIMKVDVTSPKDCLEDIIGDLNSRLGRILGTSSSGNIEIINAVVPLANMFGYGSKLSSLSNGRATFSMRYSNYEAVHNSLPPDPDNFPPAIGMRA
jgi:elongation factor G